MPSTYAHYKFAGEMLEKMPESIKDAVEKYPELYYAGCHGPDILFYYKAIKSNPVNRLGYEMHEQKAAPFFERAKGIVLQGGQPSLSYIAGFMTHFALDSACHGYVESARRKLGITHTRLEVEFDRYLLVEDGKNPVKQKLCGHIKSRKDIARTIAPFFDLPCKVIKRSLKDMKRICNMFVCPNKVKRRMLCATLKKISAELPDQIMREKPYPLCLESNKTMRKLYEEAKAAAQYLFEDFTENINQSGLCYRFDRNYE